MKLKLKNHMTRKLITINQEAPASEALRLMSNFWIRHLPVMDIRDEHVVGILSDRDLYNLESTKVPVRTLMITPVKMFDIDTPIKTIVHAMIEDKISSFLIVKEDEVVGLATSEDMLKLLEELLPQQDDTNGLHLARLFSNPTWQQTAYLIGQSGI